MLREFHSINQIQMQTRGEGVNKSEHFADIISGSSLERGVRLEQDAVDHFAVLQFLDEPVLRHVVFEVGEPDAALAPSRQRVRVDAPLELPA